MKKESVHLEDTEEIGIVSLSSLNYIPISMLTALTILFSIACGFGTHCTIIFCKIFSDLVVFFCSLIPLLACIT